MTKASQGTNAAAMPAALPLRWSARFLVVWLVLLVAWELVVRSGLHVGLFMPAPSTVLKRLMQLAVDGTLAVHLVSTLMRIAVGLVIFDDYGWDHHARPERNPRLGVDAFLNCFAGTHVNLIPPSTYTVAGRSY